MQGQVFITQGDITRLGADAVAMTSGATFNRQSAGFQALAERAKGCDFFGEYERARDVRAEGENAFWVSCHDNRAPLGVVFITVHKRARREGGQEPAYHAGKRTRRRVTRRRSGTTSGWQNCSRTK